MTFLTVLKKQPFLRARGTWMWGCQRSCSPPGRQSQSEAGKMKQRWRSGGYNPTTNPNSDFVCARNKCSFLWHHTINLLSSIDLWWLPKNDKPWGLDLFSACSEQLNSAVQRERVLGALRIMLLIKTRCSFTWFNLMQWIFPPIYQIGRIPKAEQHTFSKAVEKFSYNTNGRTKPYRGQSGQTDQNCHMWESVLQLYHTPIDTYSNACAQCRRQYEGG